MAETELRATTDAFVGSNKPTRNFGRHSTLKVQASGPVRRSYIFFGRPTPDNAKIISATLFVYLSGAWAGTNNLTVRRVTSTWKERGITFNEEPSNEALNEAAAQIVGGASGDEVAIDVTDIVQDVANGGDWFGFRLAGDATTARQLHSGEASVSGRRPRLLVQYSVEPQAPVDLVPSDGRSFSVANPRLGWTFLDADDHQAALQVQLDAVDGDFTAPTFDSGIIASGDSQYVSGYAFADAESRDWRVRAQDEAGNWSEWSEPVTIRRDVKGALAITNPAVAPDDYVEETTAPVSWTLTGRTQESYEVIIEEQVGGSWTRRWTSGRQVSATMTQTIAPGVVVSETALYRIVLRVWDTIAREGIAGDPAYVQAIREFGLQRSAVPTPTSTLVASLRDDPGVDLVWTRTGNPDSWDIVVDGITVVTDLDPTDRTHTLWTLRPRRVHTVEVVPVVNGQRAQGNPTEDVTVAVGGAWIIDPEDEVTVVILESESDPEVGDASAVHFVVGSRVPRVLTDATRGFEGTVRGVLSTYLGVTASEWRQRLLTMKGYENVRPLRYVEDEDNFPILMLGVSVPRDQEFDAYNVTVEFLQVGDFTFDLLAG